MSIYVEILIRAPLDTLWAHTQTPALHERWDLRFARIEDLPKTLETEPQRQAGAAGMTPTRTARA